MRIHGIEIDAIPLFKDNFLFTNFVFKAALKHIVKFVPIVLIHFCRLFFRAYGNDKRITFFMEKLMCQRDIIIAGIAFYLHTPSLAVDGIDAEFGLFSRYKVGKRYIIGIAKAGEQPDGNILPCLLIVEILLRRDIQRLADLFNG